MQFLDPETTKILQFLDPEIVEMDKKISGSRNCRNGAISGSRNCRKGRQILYPRAYYVSAGQKLIDRKFTEVPKNLAVDPFPDP